MGTRWTQGIILDFEKQNFPRDTNAKTISWNKLHETPNFTSAVAYLKEIFKEYFLHGAKNDGDFILNTKPLESMDNLRLLQLSNVKLEGNFKHIPAELRWLQWKKCPLKNLPSDFCPRGLTVLDLSESKIERVWGRRWWHWYSNKVAENLMVLSVGNCCSISSLPVSIEGLASIVELQLDGTSITHLPDQIGALKSLDKLEMRNCKFLTSLPESIGNLLTLTTLIIVNAAITELPESIGTLENLIMLRLNKCDQLRRLPASIGRLKSLHHLLMEGTAVTELPENFGMLSSLMILKMAKKKPYHDMPQNAENIVLPSSFSRLSFLKEFDARGWKICGKIPDDFEKLSSLEILNLGHNDFCSLPSSLRGLSILNKLFLPHCKKLKVLPPLPSSLVVVALRNVRSLSMPGSEIPDWFTQEVVCFRERKNRVIEGAIICGVVSVDHQIPDDLRDELPVIPAVEAKILRLGKPICNTAVLLSGVPKTHEDQVYLYRYPDCHPLVSYLKDGDKIQVAMFDPPIVKGVDVKKCGIHLVFENDDDYVGDEESLDASQQSVSEKLTKFVRPSEEDTRHQVETEMQEGEATELQPFKLRNSFIIFFIVLPSFLLLLSWLVFIFVV
ncbi:hypothetical protein F0562_033705 [Nyssa sinensis]|uniref:Uncharacterized protein n=1 Tax=Nyssa sinensis TaxID=561372 RepID=A0A5J5AI95_9ASTE|nr:hypothetical protein F0562_033705 [Nyssa sinensis]